MTDHQAQARKIVEASCAIVNRGDHAEIGGLDEERLVTAIAAALSAAEADGIASMEKENVELRAATQGRNARHRRRIRRAILQDSGKYMLEIERRYMGAKQRVRDLEAGLRPFAEVAACDAVRPDDHPVRERNRVESALWSYHDSRTEADYRITVMDLRRARALLSGTAAEGDGAYQQRVHTWPQEGRGRQDIDIVNGDERMIDATQVHERLRDAPAWMCAARRQGSAGGNHPADCDWPFCGCDPIASKVLEVAEECGFGKTNSWRPIATAPVDENVLLWCPDMGCESNRARIEFGPARTSRGSHHAWATMWCPAPPSPSAEAGEG